MILLPRHRWTNRVMASPFSLAPLAAAYTLLLLLNLPTALAALAPLSFEAIAAFLGPLEVALNWLHLESSDLVVGRWIYLETREQPLDPRLLAVILLRLLGLRAPRPAALPGGEAARRKAPGGCVTQPHFFRRREIQSKHALHIARLACAAPSACFGPPGLPARNKHSRER